ncbi:MAG: hypothetical protein WBG63_16130, partial [Phormidesmis sp.]
MLEFLALSSLSAGAQVLVKDVLGPLTKAAAEDFYKDFLKQSVSEAIALQAPTAFKKAVAQSMKDFLVLFGNELDTCGLPSALVNHEFATPLQRLTNDPEVRAFLGRAFNTEVTKLESDFLAERWQDSPDSRLPEEFDWAQLTKTYVRRVKALIRSDAELNRQLELDYQERIRANTDEIVGVKVVLDLKQYQEALKEKFGALSLDSLDTTGAAYDNVRLWKIFVAQDVRECAEFAPQMYEMPRERLLKLQEAGEIDPLLSVDALEQQRRTYAEKPVESVRGVVGLAGERSVLRSVILGDPGSGKSTLLRAMALSWAEKPMAELKD